MTCVGCSDRDRTYTWADLKPKKRSLMEVVYIHARARADRLWKIYCQSVDMWVERGMYNAMEEFEELCKQADLKAHMMYVKLNGINVEDGE